LFHKKAKTKYKNLFANIIMEVQNNKYNKDSLKPRTTHSRLLDSSKEESQSKRNAQHVHTRTAP
jgi:hypothetical protein